MVPKTERGGNLMRYFGFILAAALLSSQAGAATIFKCVDASGKVTFTKGQNCPDNTGLDDVVRAHNPRISGSSAPVQMARPRVNASPSAAAGEYGAPQPQQAPRRGVAVVGGSAPRVECDTGLSDRDLRTAKVRGEIVPGMSRKDVESMYGKPNRDGGARGAGTSTYWNDKYLDVTSVNYDRRGCVRSSYQSGHKN